MHVSLKWSRVRPHLAIPPSTIERRRTWTSASNAIARNPLGRTSSTAAQRVAVNFRTEFCVNRSVLCDFSFSYVLKCEHLTG